MGKHRRAPEKKATYGEVIAIREFRALWYGQALSLLGDQLAQVALAVLVYERTRSPLATAAVYALTYLPQIVGGPFLAGLADRFPRRRVMISCDILRGVLVALMAVPGMPLPAVCLLVFFVVLLSAPFSAARAALLPEVLEGDRYVAGSALQNMTNQAMQMLGFAAGGAMIAILGPYRALAIDAASFLFSALILASGVRRRRTAAKSGRRASMWTMTKAGATLVFGDRKLRTLVLFAWLCGFYVLPEGIAVPYAIALYGGANTPPGIEATWERGHVPSKDSGSAGSAEGGGTEPVDIDGTALTSGATPFDTGGIDWGAIFLDGGALPVPVIAGLLMAAMPTGTVLGAFLFSRFVSPSGRLRAMGWLAMLSCAPLIGCAMRPPLAVVLVLWVASGIGGAYQLAANAAFVQCVPAERRGQAFGLVQSGLMAAQGIGILVGGLATEKLGPEPVVALAGVSGLTVAAVLAMVWAESRGDLLTRVRAQATA
ncbi:MFS transporter [Thermoactinospora rubra]|uniref:MFS transporter n=1 Tax=Thermoactinospora rubra TaxID=1088767 RepID=UPI001F0AEF8F|nr:MFS transporter [Thermoactinospora rubra]